MSYFKCEGCTNEDMEKCTHWRWCSANDFEWYVARPNTADGTN